MNKVHIVDADERKEEGKTIFNDLLEKEDSEFKELDKLNVSDYIRLDKKIKELEAQRKIMKPGIIAYMKTHNLKTLSKITLCMTTKTELDAMKVYKFLGFKKFMTIAKVTKTDTEQYLNKIDMGKCESDEITEPEYSLRVNHGAID